MSRSSFLPGCIVRRTSPQHARTASRSGLRLALVLALTIGLLLPAGVRPAYAYDYDTHYLWTYYLALHAGFTERQAFQIGSASFAIDEDPDTGPLHAQAMDSLFGFESELRSDEVKQATGDLVVSGRDLLRRVHQAMTSTLREVGDPAGNLSERNLRMLAQRFEEMLDGMPDSSFFYGQSYEYWKEVSRPVIRNVWSNFHAFAESELLPAAVQAVPFDDENRVDAYLMQVLWNFMPLWIYLDPTHFPPGLLEQRPGKIQIITDEANAARDRDANLLWRMALAERNPGPLIHYTQDSFSHFDFDNIRGHASWGHQPDFMSYDRPKSQRMTIATLHTLCRYRDAIVPASVSDGEGAPGYQRSELCDRLFVSLEHDPEAPITLYTQQMDMAPFLEDPVGARVGGGATPVTSPDASATLARIFEVLDRMIEANPIPEHIGNWDPGMLPREWFSTLSRGVVSHETALLAIRQAIAEDKQNGLLPSAPAGNLEGKWGYPPAVARLGGPAGDALGVDKGRVWPEWAVPEHYTEFDYNGAGSVLLHDPENYLGSSTFVARVESLSAIADRFEEIYPVELPHVVFAGPVEVRFEQSTATDPNAGEADLIDVFLTLEYEVAGIKDLLSVNWVGETVYWDGEFVRISQPTGERAQAPIPLPVIEACTFEGHPYELLQRGDRRGPDNRWGENGSGDDWGTRIQARDVAAGDGDSGCRSCVETELHFKIPKSLLSGGSLNGTCTVHLYAQAPWETTFRVPVALVNIGRVKR